ncbi:hypothetical protein EVAR_20208_1 [Eumeta japonica]|uniref:Uncharacterized protein n=1 Tax=Eumeta variegata TaxID=151549 RepID=A0A4C1UTW2_EUMVA|nr:hypothetical protein EVAR_20208_1 [Eumeta japonica]
MSPRLHKLMVHLIHHGRLNGDVPMQPTAQGRYAKRAKVRKIRILMSHRLSHGLFVFANDSSRTGAASGRRFWVQIRTVAGSEIEIDCGTVSRIEDETITKIENGTILTTRSIIVKDEGIYSMSMQAEPGESIVYKQATYRKGDVPVCVEDNDWIRPRRPSITPPSSPLTLLDSLLPSYPIRRYFAKPLCLVRTAAEEREKSRYNKGGKKGGRRGQIISPGQAGGIETSIRRLRGDVLRDDIGQC